MTKRGVGSAVVVMMLAGTGCNVPISGAMLQGDLFQEVRDPAFLAQVCGFPVSEVDANLASTATLQLTNITGTRALFGSEGHGTAHLVFTPQSMPGQRCEGNIAFDFSQQSRVTGRTRRSVQTSSTFYFANVRLTGH